MTVRALDANGDLIIGRTQFYDGYSAAEVAQNVRTRLKLFTNEWFLNTQEGTPWFENGSTPGLMGKGRTQANREAVLRRRILLSPGCSAMSAFNVDFDLAERRLTVTSSIISASGASADVAFVQAVS